MTSLPELKSCELLPCPFCGGEAQIVGTDSMYYAACTNIGCFCCVGEGYDRDAMPDHAFISEQLAAKEWNARTPSPHNKECGAVGKEACTAHDQIAEDCEGCDLDKKYGLPHTGEKQPPIDNDHVAEGCDKFSQETIEMNKTATIEDAELREAVNLLNKWPTVPWFKGRTVLQRAIQTLINHAMKGQRG